MIEHQGYTLEELQITKEKVTALENVHFWDVRRLPEMRIYGLLTAEDGHRFCRIPEDVAESAANESKDVAIRALNYQTAGGRLRFVTTSGYVAIKTLCGNSHHRANGSAMGTSGFDLYIKRGGRDVFAGSISSPEIAPGGYVSVIMLPEGEKEVTINFPPCCETSDLYIGLDKNSSISRHSDYTVEKPIVFCGSSITQGGCASRPGMAYSCIISRHYDLNFLNLGFSDGFCAKEAFIKYISSLDCSVLVMEYDHNATLEELRETHEKLYLHFRDTHPDTPVVIVGSPDCEANSESPLRREIIFNTFNNARLRGEKVVFVDGYALFGGELREECTVDGIHPNDLGMTRMADVIGKAVHFALSM